MNFGSQNAKEYSYDEKQAVEAVNQGRRVPWEMIERQIDEARSWYDSRGNAGDNVSESALDAFETAVTDRDREETVRTAFDLLSGRMHPTARDIVSTPCKQAVYNITGRRAYRFEIEGGN